MEKEQLKEIIEENCTEDRLFDMITYFFNNNLKYPPLKDKAGDRNHQKYLLYFDNAEELITNDWKHSFRYWLSRTLEECNSLSIVMTSKKGILPDELSKLSIPPEVVYLKQLRSIPSVELFLILSSATIFPQDIFDLILMDSKYPIKKLLPDCGLDAIPEKPSEEFKERLKRKVQ